MKYYKVITKCGHVGRKSYIPITFAINAESGKEASKVARNLPRVKHNRRFAIISCEEIMHDEYLEIKRINNNDPYLNCKNIQQQNLIDLSDRICVDDEFRIPLYSKEERKHRVEFKKKKEREYLKSMEVDLYGYCCK